MRLPIFILCVFSIFHLSNAQSGLNVNQGTEVNSAGYLTVGDENGDHISIDKDDIQRKSNSSFSKLYLNFYGGDVQIGSGEGRISYSRDRQAVGIGTALPSAKLHVDGTTDASLISNGLLLIGESASTQNLIMDANEIMSRNNGSAASLFINRDGGNVEFFGFGDADFIVHDLPFGDRSNMQYESSTGKFFYDNSSRRYKENITTLEDDWYKILKLRPTTYTRPSDKEHWEYGYIAEEVDAIGLTTMVGYDPEGNPEDVRYDKMIIYLVEMLKIQQQEIAELKEQMPRRKRRKK